MSSNETTSDSLTGTVKGPGERPHEYLFITADQLRARIGEFVYYVARDGQHERRIIGNVTSRRLVRNLPDSFSADPETPPAIISSLIGLDGEGCELYEITVGASGYFSERLGDFVNPRTRPGPAPVYPPPPNAPRGASPARRRARLGHFGILLTRGAAKCPRALHARRCLHAPRILASRAGQILHGASSSKIDVPYQPGRLARSARRVRTLSFRRIRRALPDPGGDYAPRSNLHARPLKCASLP